ncbi:MAG TPA: hypothetical protein VES73_16910 [Lamprocystis sp. (in: g-proteobacteria)]|nr:hypothetical protein [Lamprocystis sp. (in: g-proteobacteria)]
MATLTAQMLAGIGHPNDDGLLLHATLGLYENSRPCWQLDIRTDRPNHSAAPPAPRRIWIPSHPERILEEGLLMLALYVWRQPAVRQQARIPLGLDLRGPRQDLTTLDPADLAALCETARGLPCPGKLALMVLNGSYLRQQLPRLEQWPLQAEVCTPQWWRIQKGCPPRSGTMGIADHCT